MCVNFRPLNVENLGGPTSMNPIIPMMVDFEVQNCTTTGVFDDPLEFTCRHWRRTQHIIYEFWT